MRGEGRGGETRDILRALPGEKSGKRNTCLGDRFCPRTKKEKKRGKRSHLFHGRRTRGKGGGGREKGQSVSNAVAIPKIEKGRGKRESTMTNQIGNLFFTGWPGKRGKGPLSWGGGRSGRVVIPRRQGKTKEGGNGKCSRVKEEGGRCVPLSAKELEKGGVMPFSFNFWEKKCPAFPVPAER